MKKLLVILFVSFLLFAPDIAQAKSDKKCKKEDPSCTVSQDDGDRDRDKDDSRDDDQERGDWDNGSDDDGDRDGRDKDKDDRDKRDRDKDDDDDDREGRDKDKDDRDKRDRDKDDDDDDDDRDKRDKDNDEDRDKRDRDKDDHDRRDRDHDDDDDDDGEDRDRDDDDDDDDDGEDRDRDDDDDDSEDKPKKDACRKIGDGGIYTQSGDLIILGFDAFGYNYQAHKFQGFADNADRSVPPVTGGKVYLKMKWNDTYLSNRDCDGDGHLDRHYGHETFYGTDAWLTNMYKWSYIGDDGEVHWVHWFLKATAKPSADFDCSSIGADIYNSHFCWVKNEYRDPYGGSQGFEVLLSLLGFRD